MEYGYWLDSVTSAIIENPINAKLDTNSITNMNRSEIFPRKIQLFNKFHFVIIIRRKYLVSFFDVQFVSGSNVEGGFSRSRQLYANLVDSIVWDSIRSQIPEKGRNYIFERGKWRTTIRKSERRSTCVRASSLATHTVSFNFNFFFSLRGHWLTLMNYFGEKGSNSSMRAGVKGKNST